MVTLYKAPDAQSAFRAAQLIPVRVNGQIIDPDLIAREAQLHPAPTALQSWHAAARALVVRELLLQEAAARGCSANPKADAEGRRETGEDARIRALIEAEVSTPKPDEAACRRYYEHNRARFRSSDIFEASHILLAVRPSDADPLAEARQTAKLLLDCLAKSPESFADLAAGHSACPSSKSGGNLGQITKGDTTPAFEAALLRLSPGEMTAEPVETPYGLHIIRLHRRIDGETLPFEAVSERIARYLVEASERQAVAQYLARLASDAEIDGVDMPTRADMRVS